MIRTFVDLFCGAGGFTEGFLLSGVNSNFELIAANDVNSMVEQTYEGRFRDQLDLPHDFIRGDIRDKNVVRSLTEAVVSRLAGRPLDVLCGGPPCQGFSVFGRRDSADPRNELFSHYLDVIDILKPRYFVMENVPGIIRMYGGGTVARIEQGVGNLSTRYSISDPIMVNAADFGVPQLRERVIFIGSREDVPIVDSIPSTVATEDRVTVRDAIADLAFLKPWQSASRYEEQYQPTSNYQLDSRRGRLFARLGLPRPNEDLYNHEAARHSPQVIARFSLIERGEGLESVPRGLWENHLETAKKWCVKLDDRRPSYTVMTLPDDLVHYSQPRILTVRELARLQSFDDTFRFFGPRSTGGGGAGNRKRATEVPQYSQVGNAVPPLLAKAIGDILLDALNCLETGTSPKASVRRSRQQRLPIYIDADAALVGLRTGVRPGGST
jgi:DNA (cytosine-5)-methyltransferase 1